MPDQKRERRTKDDIMVLRYELSKLIVTHSPPLT
jgi:hypothetical protein